MSFENVLQQSGAVLAPDGIPLHFGDQRAEVQAALESVALLVRSHEGRVEITGRDRLAFIHRISTNDLISLPPGAGRPTIFTDANARILDRAIIYNRGESALAVTEPGRGSALARYLQRNIFFNDDARVSDLTPATHQFALLGPRAAELVRALVSDASLPPDSDQLPGMDVTVGGVPVFLAQATPIAGPRWLAITPADHAVTLWNALRERGAAFGLRPAGSLAYNVLRISSGRPAVGRELTQEYIPLEVGLTDEVSFSKGCYTGQEIIARMESRGRLARVMVTVRLDAPVEAPADVTQEGRVVGKLTSSVTTPDGQHVGIAVVKTPVAIGGEPLYVGPEHVPAIQTGLAGAAPPMLAPESHDTT